MPIKIVKHETDPQHHVDRIVLQDHFGKQHHVVVHPFIVRDKAGSPGEYEVIEVDVEAAIQAEIKLMELRERHFLKHMQKHHPQHAKTLSFPENQHSALSIQHSAKAMPTPQSLTADKSSS